MSLNLLYNQYLIEAIVLLSTICTIIYLRKMLRDKITINGEKSLIALKIAGIKNRASLTQIIQAATKWGPDARNELKVVLEDWTGKELDCLMTDGG